MKSNLIHKKNSMENRISYLLHLRSHSEILGNKSLFNISKVLQYVLFRVVLGLAYRGLTGGFLLLRIFSVGISVSPHVCFIFDLILISMFLRLHL